MSLREMIFGCKKPEMINIETEGIKFRRDMDDKITVQPARLKQITAERYSEISKEMTDELYNLLNELNESEDALLDKIRKVSK